MALELVVADMIATIYRNTADPKQSIELKRSRFQWLLNENEADVTDAMLGKFYPEELQNAVDQLFATARALASRNLS